MLQLDLICPYCHKTLMNNEEKLDNRASVDTEIYYGGEKGHIYLCSTYGDYSKKCSIEVPDGEIVQLFCPHCHHELGSTTKCNKCGAPMIGMNNRSGGVIRICSRFGCKKHHVEFEDLENELEAFYDEYSLYSQGG